jgi:hypothetical protein
MGIWTFGAIVAICGLWLFWMWTRVAKHGAAFVSVLLDSMSLALWVGTGIYAEAAGFNQDPRRSIGPMLAIFGVVVSITAVVFGLKSSMTQERGGLSATLFAVVIGLIWLPSTFV